MESAKVEIDGVRHYRNPLFGDKPTPSVTTILDDVITEDWSKWAAGRAVDYVFKNLNQRLSRTKLKERAIADPGVYYGRQGEIGTRLHDLAEDPEGDSSQLDPEEEMPEVLVAAESWDMFKNDFPHTLLSSQVEVFGKVPADPVLGILELGFGGTYDVELGFSDGRNILVDFKTSREVQYKHALQLAAYAIASGKAFSELWILHLGKQHPFYDPVPVDLDEAWVDFCLATRVYYRKRAAEHVWSR